MTPRGTPASFYEAASVKRELTLADVVLDVWAARWFLVVGSVIGAAMAAAFLFFATPSYKAQIILSPANPMNGAESSSLLANDNLFALRYLVQRVGMPSSSDFARFETIYAGPRVAAALMQDERIVAGVSADPTYGLFQGEQNWNPVKMAAYIQDNVRLSAVGGGSLRRMVYWHPNPEFAVYLLGQVHAVTDSMIRTRIREDSSERVAYLRRAIDTTNNPEHRRALTTLLLEQERLRMLVSINQNYAASVIEPASASFRAEWPSAFLTFAAFLFVGAFLGFAAFGIRNARV